MESKLPRLVFRVSVVRWQATFPVSFPHPVHDNPFPFLLYNSLPLILHLLNLIRDLFLQVQGHHIPGEHFLFFQELKEMLFYLYVVYVNPSTYLILPCDLAQCLPDFLSLLAQDTF